MLNKTFFKTGFYKSVKNREIDNQFEKNSFNYPNINKSRSSEMRKNLTTNKANMNEEGDICDLLSKNVGEYISQELKPKESKNNTQLTL